MYRTFLALLVAMTPVLDDARGDSPDPEEGAEVRADRVHEPGTDSDAADATLREETEAEVRYAIAYELWLLDVFDRAQRSGEPELLVAAAMLAASPVLRAHDLGADRVDTLFRRAVAGATLRPDLLALLDFVCTSIRDPVVYFDDAVAPFLPAVCADADFGAKLTAIEPANAYHWVMRAGQAKALGDNEAARAFLLATGRSSYWKPTFRDRLAVLYRMVSRWPPGTEVEDAARALEALPRTPDVYADAMMGAWRNPELFAALQAQGLAMFAFDTRALSVPPRLCREAVAASDAALLAVCRRLARLWIDSGETISDVLAGYRLLVDIETPAASARARQDLHEFRERHYSAYWRALREHDISPDLLADFRNLMNHGEIEMMRRGLARVEAQVGSERQAAVPVAGSAAPSQQQGVKRP